MYFSLKREAAALFSELRWRVYILKLLSDSILLTTWCYLPWNISSISNNLNSICCFKIKSCAVTAMRLERTYRACAVLLVHMAIRSEAMLQAWIDSATTTCVFIDSSLGFHWCTHAPRPLFSGPSFLCLFPSHALPFYVPMWETALFDIPLLMSGVIFPTSKEALFAVHRGCYLFVLLFFF